jgi:hypothetical protein
MRGVLSLLAAFTGGLLVRDVLKLAYMRWLYWKMEREFVASTARMVGCRHERTIKVFTGMYPLTDKCLDCWALHFTRGPVDLPEWCANVVSPEDAAKSTASHHPPRSP